MKPLRIAYCDMRKHKGPPNQYKIRAAKHVEGTFYSHIRTKEKNNGHRND